MRKITIKDVAKKAGVGVGTVSRVLNNQAHVSSEKRDKVLAAINELEYQPDEIARSLKTKVTKNIGVFLNDITNPFYADLLRGLETEASESGYSIIFIDLYLQKENWIEKIYKYYQTKVDGVVYVGSPVTDEVVDTFENSKMPAVFASSTIDMKDKNRPIHYVDIDNVKAAYDATMALIEYGHEHIALILGNIDDRNSTLLRKAGYEQAMLENKLPIREEWVHYGSFTFESGYEAMQRVLAHDDYPTAVFAISDLMAIGAAKAVIEHGLSIPEDISIIGFDGINNSLYYHPAITTVNQPRYEMGRLACEMIIKRINNMKVKEQLRILDHEILYRASLKRR